MASKKLQINEETEVEVKQGEKDMERIAEQSDSLNPLSDEEIEAAVNGLGDDTELLSDPLGYESGEKSKAEELAEKGESTMELDGEKIEVSKGAAKRFAMFDADGNGVFSKEEVGLIKDQIKKNNQTVGLKDNSDGPVRLGDGEGTRFDTVPFEYASDIHSKKAKEYFKEHNIDIDDADKLVFNLGKDGEDGVITVINVTKRHYEGPLGTFDYDIKDYAIGYKTVYDEIGGESVSAEIPVLKYVGNNTNKTSFDTIHIPEGVKCLDYTFEGNDKVKNIPILPDSVESMHAAFKGCSALRRPDADMKQGEIAEGFWAAVGDCFRPSTWGHWHEGGVCKPPSNIKDLSYCFMDCTNLQEAFTNTDAATQLENMDGYALNCGKLETILDVSQAKYLPVSAQTDAYEGVNTKMIKSIGGVELDDDAKANIEVEKNEEGEGEDKKVTKVLKVKGDYAGISMYANEDSIYSPGKNETNPYSVDEREHLRYVKALQDYRANDRMYLADPSAVANATNGLASSATYVDSNGVVHHTDDPTKQNEDNGGLLGSLFGKNSMLGGIMGGDTGQLIQRLGFGFLEYKAVKIFCKNPLVALGIVGGGQALGILPGTIGGFGKTLSSIGGLFGGGIGGMLGTLGEKLQGAESKLEKGPDYMTKEEASDMNAIVDAQQAKEAQTNALSDSALAKLGDNMMKRGAYTAEYGTFQELAEVQEGYGVFNNVRMASEDSMAALDVAILKKIQEDGGELSDESKVQIAKTSKQILKSWETYGDTALDSLRETYGGDPNERAKGEAGLAKMMRAAVQPDIEIIKGLDEKYGFLSDTDKAELDGMQFAGLEGAVFTEYVPGTNFAPEEDIYLKRVDDKGNELDGIFDDFNPEEYDIDIFEEKAAAKHDLDTRTENYVSSFGDGGDFAKGASTENTEVGKAVKSRPLPAPAPEEPQGGDDEFEM